jgi:hypothetical protein
MYWNIDPTAEKVVRRQSVTPRWRVKENPRIVEDMHLISAAGMYRLHVQYASIIYKYEKSIRRNCCSQTGVPTERYS